MAKGDFGGYRVNFSKVGENTLKEVFGEEDLKPSDMTKKLWMFVKRHRLSNK